MCWRPGRALVCAALLVLASFGLLSCLDPWPAAPLALPAPTADWPELGPHPTSQARAEPSPTPWHYAVVYPGLSPTAPPAPSEAATPSHGSPPVATGVASATPIPDGPRWPTPGLYALSLFSRAPGLDAAPGRGTPTVAPRAAVGVVGPAVTPSAEETASPEGFPGLSLISDRNILLLGTDRREGEGAWRTDAIVVAALRPQAGYVGLFSIPRDLWVEIPDYGAQRVNVVDFLGEYRYGPGGGPALLAATLEENLGITVHGYARVHLEGLVEIVDVLGGVTVDVERDHPAIDVEAGLQTMDGETALWYARDRSRSDDLDRTRRQQQILLAIAQAVLRPASLPRLPALVSVVCSAVETDLTPAQLLALFRLGQDLGAPGLRTRTLDRTMVEDWVTPQGAMVLLPVRSRIEEAWTALTSS